jgi:hypothetical protein
MRKTWYFDIRFPYDSLSTLTRTVQLNKRGAEYSRRPPSIYTNIRSGYKRMLLLQPGDELMRQRRAMQIMLRPEGFFLSMLGSDSVHSYV